MPMAALANNPVNNAFSSFFNPLNLFSENLSACNMSELGGEAISSTQSMVLDLPPSCIEFCPSHPSFFAVGTYYLEKAEEADQSKDDGEDSSEAKTTQTQSRNGSIIVFRLQNGKACPIQTIPQPSAVFDLHFSPLPDQGDVCAAVSSTGTISFFRLCPDTDDRTAAGADILKPLSVLRIPDLGEDVLFTYFAWHPTVRGLMAVTTASGTVILVQAHADYQGLDVLEESVLEHSLEAWVTAFSPPSLEAEPTGEQQQRHPFTIFSGGDDSALKYTTYYPSPPPSKSTQSSSSTVDDDDEEEEGSHNNTPFSALTLRGHNAGVTSILPFHTPAAHHRHLVLLTGSYDDTLRIYAITPPHLAHAAPQRPTLLAEKNLGGGVWRLSLLGPPIADVNGEAGTWAVTVLASCMHAGTRIVRIRGRAEGDGGAAAAVEVEEMEVLARFEEHASMNYGSDWSRTESRLLASPGTAEGEKGGEVLCVSTSFYDRLLCVWRCPLPAV